MGTWWDYVTSIAGDVNGTDIARRMGINPSSVSNWKGGKSHPSWETVIQFAEAYDQNPVQALIAAGYLKPDTVTTITVPRAASDLPTRELLDEFYNRYAEFEEWRENRRNRKKKNNPELSILPDAPAF